MEVFTFENEDHTLGALLQEELLQNRDVVFAGYIAEHPLEKVIKVKIQTRKNVKVNNEKNDNNEEKENITVPVITPNKALSVAIENLVVKLDTLEENFKNLES